MYLSFLVFEFRNNENANKLSILLGIRIIGSLFNIVFSTRVQQQLQECRHATIFNFSQVPMHLLLSPGSNRLALIPNYFGTFFIFERASPTCMMYY